MIAKLYIMDNISFKNNSAKIEYLVINTTFNLNALIAKKMASHEPGQRIMDW